MKQDMQLAKAIIQEIRATPKASKKRTWDEFKKGLENDTEIDSTSPIRKRKIDLVGDYRDQQHIATTTTRGNTTALLSPDNHLVRPPNQDTGLA